GQRNPAGVLGDLRTVAVPLDLVAPVGARRQRRRRDRHHGSDRVHPFFPSCPPCYRRFNVASRESSCCRSCTSWARLTVTIPLAGESAVAPVVPTAGGGLSDTIIRSSSCCMSEIRTRMSSS